MIIPSSIHGQSMPALYSPLLHSTVPVMTRHVMTHYLSVYEAETPVCEVLDDLIFRQSPWIFIHRNQKIVGVVEADSVSLVQSPESSASNIPLSALQMFSVVVTLPNTPIDDVIKTLSFEQPLLLVCNDEGVPLGYVDRTLHLRLQSRYQLNSDSCTHLLTDPWIQKISTISKQVDVPVYIIGGFVRDWMLGSHSPDLDVTVEGDVLMVANALAEQFGGVVHTFDHFAGIHWISECGFTIDLTACRAEIYPSLSALPTVAVSHITKDLERRDFNINAMAISIHPDTFGLLLDPFDGLRSLERRQFQTLHGSSLLQDPTRIFRASRYAARFNIQPTPSLRIQIQGAVQQITPGIELTWTRIGIELDKILHEPNPTTCFERLANWGVLSAWFPFWQHIQFPTPSNNTLSQTHSEHQMMYWMLLALDIPPELQTKLEGLIGIRAHALKTWQQLKRDLPNMTEKLSKISLHSPDFEIHIGTALQNSTLIHRLLLEHQHSEFRPLLQWWVDVGQHRTRTLSGKDILHLGVSPGPIVQELLMMAQKIAWKGGDADAERRVLLTHLENRP